MSNHCTEKLTIQEFLTLFGYPDDQSQLGSADSDEYLTLVNYLVARSKTG
jgi:hypothetical protein